ncbi:hypothetical protein E2562_031170 [Oryza meyeriana var. granulata]|uniref:Uncharacterized protein n=1 Tax=Oryza meyeriana var. granulata TaxID=110450 RepID=A0A6G1EC12_9ORYZ|nr:hypothetical protein E2562_031170 [Oryza meyeriana var. granulata]
MWRWHEEAAARRLRGREEGEEEAAAVRGDRGRSGGKIVSRKRKKLPTVEYGAPYVPVGDGADEEDFGVSIE